ncbi:MAG TPA: hypothetical protein VLA39_05895 [Marinobacterium sp.]|nr:hypothetical protein [Marinobacterium sp.]
MRVQLEVHDNSVEVRTTVPRGKVSEMELYLFLPPEMSLKERGFDATSFLGLKTSRYHYSVSKVKLPLLRHRSGRAESNIDFPIFLKTFKLNLSRLARQANSAEELDAFIDLATSLLEELRSIDVDEENQKEFRTVDELCSYYAEQITYVCIETNQKRDSGIALDRLFEFASREYEYRLRQYGSKASEAQHIRRKEDFFCKSINIRRENQKLTVLREQFAFSISAFLSMLLTTLVVFYFQAGYGTFSFAVFMALCVSYIFKDRFKELFRVFVAKKLNAGRFRVRATLTDFDNRPVGRCYDLAEFVQPDDEIQAVRGRGKFTKRETGESVLLYKKRYDISKDLKSGFSEIRDTMDINFHTLVEMLPDLSLRHFKVENGELLKSNYEMLYDVNLVLRINGSKIERYRLKVSHNSIVRFETVSLPNQNQAKPVIQQSVESTVRKLSQREGAYEQ